MTINTETDERQMTKEEICTEDSATELAHERVASDDIADDDWATLWELRKEKLRSRLGRC